MNTIYTSESIYKQFLINQFHNQLIQTNKTMTTQSNLNPNLNPKPNINIKPDLPKELCDIIKSYCFYDTVSYQKMSNTIQYKVDICDIIKEHVINNEQLFIDYFEHEDEDEETPHNLNHETVIYTIQKYNPLENTFYFSMSNVIDICLKCGNYVSCSTPDIPNNIRCTC